MSPTRIPRCTSEGLEDSIKDRKKETKKIKNSQQDLFENPLTKDDIKIASIIFDASKTQILGEISDGMFNTWVRPLWFVNFDSATRQVVIGVFSDMALQALKNEKIDDSTAKRFVHPTIDAKVGREGLIMPLNIFQMGIIGEKYHPSGSKYTNFFGTPSYFSGVIDVMFAKIFKRLWTAEVSLVFIVKTPDNKLKNFGEKK
ncbi:MAG: hypothetical protein NTZ74_04695 [Chloroflexi bacterium]|nr:hypothetical protein [Chloroflexota bacterium]